jgi:hypothetical protein
MTGVHDYRMCVGDAWVLAQYDAKNSLLTVAVDECFPLGNQNLELVVKDKAGNTRIHGLPLLIEGSDPSSFLPEP